MKQVIVIKLEPSQEQYQALLRTVEAFNRGCQYAADVAYEKRLANKIALQPFVYGTLRSVVRSVLSDGDTRHCEGRGSLQARQANPR